MFSVATLILAAAASTTTAPLEPASPWAFEAAPTVCRATRTFGTAGDTTIRLVAAPLTRRYVLTVDLPTPAIVSYGDPVRVIFEPSGREEQGRAIGFAAEGTEQRTLGSYIDATALSHESVTAIRLIVRDRTVAYLAVGDAAHFIAQLGKCEREMLDRFGVDPVEQAAVASPPEPLGRSETWFTPDFYPAAALRAAAEGKVGVRFRVREDGSVSDCVTVVSSGNAALDDGTCITVLARARYRPARDARGRAVPSAQIIFARWVLPAH